MKSTNELIADTACFLIPSANFFQIHVVGEIPGGELLILLLFLPLLLYRGYRVCVGRNKTLLLLLASWFLGQLVTDIYRHTSPPDMEKGLALICFFALDLIALSLLLYRNQARMLLFALGVLPALIVQCVQQGYETLRPDLAWKLGLAPILNPSLLLIACYLFSRRQYLAVFALDACLATTNLYFNYRSAALIIAVSCVLLLPFDRHPPTFRWEVLAVSNKRLPSRVLLTLTLVSGMGLAMSYLYSYFAGSGMLGADAQLKYTLESRGKYGLIVGGRPETLVSGVAVLDSPILGHGSWAKDTKYTELLSDQLRATGYAENDLQARYGDQDSSLIPTHSHLMTAWVFSGILGAAFWLYALALCIRGALSLSGSRLMLAPYFSFLLVLSIWDIFFSPFASYRRLLVAFVLVIVNSLLYKQASGDDTKRPRWSISPSETKLSPAMPRFPYHCGR